MAVYKRGETYWYEFVFNGERIRKSTKQGNKRVAEQMEAARKTQLAKREVGIQERKPVPVLKDFATQFAAAIQVQCAEKPRTVDFYEAKLRTLVADRFLGNARIDMIDEAAIEKYVQARSRVISRRKSLLSPGSINRELATLRRMLRLAHEWRFIERVPKIRLLRGERNREFVLNVLQEDLYLSACPHPLADVATLLLDTGLRLGEALSLEWPQIRMEAAPGAKFGYITVLSRKAKNNKSRNVPLSERSIAVLAKWGPKSTGFVFHREDGSPISDSHLDQQHARIRSLLKFPSDFVLHSLRHTFGTRLGESGAEAFTIMKLMGHSSVTVSQRYVHPSPEAVELAYERLIALNRQKVPTKAPTAEMTHAEQVQQVM
jgi:integrase